MLYRLIPPASLQWNGDFPAGSQTFNSLVEHGADFDKLEWEATKERVLSLDLVRVALRHGVATNVGIVLSGMHTVHLGRADALRLGQLAIDENQAKIREQSGPLMETLMPGWAKSGQELDARVRESTENIAKEAEADLGRVLAAPVDPVLAEHWVRLGGALPD